MITFKNWIPAIIIMLIIFFVSAVPGQTINSVGLGNERLHVNGHFIMFFFLGFTLYKATKNIGKALIIATIYAFLDEFHQSFVPLRTATFYDIGVDIFGILLAGIILWKLQYILPKKLINWLKS